MNTSHRAFKGPLFDQFARIGKAVANPHRLELIDLIAQGERPVDDLAHEADLPVANTSQHLQVLKQAGLVETRRAGNFIYYRLADERVFRLWQAIRDVGEARLAEIDRLTNTFLTDRAHLEAVDAATLLRRLGDGDIVVLDVRPAEEYRSGHIPGARSIPITELEQRLQEVPHGREIVAYCRGPYCVFADEAASLLTAKGFRALRLEGGFPDWKLDGGAVAQGAAR